MTVVERRPEAVPPPEPDYEEIWEDKPGLVGFLTSVDHKRIGMRYIVTAFIFFFAAGLMALVMRVQLTRPDESVVGAELYNQLFTMHGVTMIFLFNTPVLAGFGNYLLPLMLGSRDMAFPRLNAFSYWIYLGSGIFFYASFLIGKMPDGGWFAYTPLTDRPFSPGVNLDFWGLGVIFVGISTTVGAVNFIVSTFKMRAPGMTVNRMPMFVWSILGMAFMIIFAVPVLTVAAALLEADRLFHFNFYIPALGGNVLLYQHLFWFWGHPEVYILFLPATGMVSMMIPVFSRRPLAGYLWVAAALMAIAFISFGVWVHHMFATGMPAQAMGYFSAASLVIAIPSGIQFFAWIGTMWGGRVTLAPPMLFCLGFLLIFLLGGITGVMVAVMPFDWQVTDSYFIVAHFHYVLNGAVVFPIFGALYYWLPKMTGKMLSNRLGTISFWTMFVGFNLAFFPMHLLGMAGMPRRVYTYASGLGWDTPNIVVTVGSAIFGLGTGITLFAIIWARFRGEPAPANPWDADSLEWSTTSPPPDQNFTEIPVVNSRHPLWTPLSPDERSALEATAFEPVDGDGARVVSSIGAAGAMDRTTPVTTGVDTVPEDLLRIPEPTYLPFFSAAGVLVFFFGLLWNAPVVLAVGVVVLLAGLVRWAWRTEWDLQ